ncbi:hypothetical protein [Pandoraea pneumonica]|uniref:hypothetical protein n=1 Tax=Pandoraea pneumonica TaxID=2508299 RepID=UPI00123F480E|nr:hypothetical protein [Pandoraea pneumonica]
MAMSIGALSVLVFGGCTSIQDVKQRAPDFTAASSKKPANVGGCVASQWRSNDVDFRYSPLGDGVEIAVGDPGYYYAVFEATPDSNGSKVSFFSRSWFGNEKMLRGVKACV